MPRGRITGMKAKRSITVPVAVAAVVLLVVALTAYVGGYFLLGEREDINSNEGRLMARVRLFPSHALQMAYAPMGYLEGAILGIDTGVIWSNPDVEPLPKIRSH
jgi:fructose-1,6-bisphosphatase/inositol monophosphatase family enzyme